MPLLNNPNAKVPFVSSGGVLSINGGLRLIQAIINAINGTAASDTVPAALLTLGNGLNIYVGSGNPNGVITESPGAIFINRAGGAGTTLWVKETGTNTNSGWTGK